MKKSSAAGERPFPTSLDDALKVLPGANLAMISVAGRYRPRWRHKALEKGLHVMLFSDNVPLERKSPSRSSPTRKA